MTTRKNARDSPLLVVALLALSLAVVPTAAAIPPVCIVKTVGTEGGKAYVEVWLHCGIQWTVTTCPKDGFCTTVSSEDVPMAAGNCHHVISGYGWDKWFCLDAKGPIGCKAYWMTTWWETCTTYDCIA